MDYCSDAVADYLCVDEFNRLFMKAKDPLKYDGMYQTMDNDWISEWKKSKYFQPQYNVMTEWIPVSPSTIRRNLKKIYDLWV